MEAPKFETTDAYINSFSGTVKERLEEIRKIISTAAPQATEKISYGIPTFYLHGNLVHFAGYKNHIGFYPAPTGSEAFAAALSAYKTGKGSVQFPHSQPLPPDLIRRMVKFRVAENEQKAAVKKKSR